MWGPTEANTASPQQRAEVFCLNLLGVPVNRATETIQTTEAHLKPLPLPTQFSVLLLQQLDLHGSSLAALLDPTNPSHTQTSKEVTRRHILKALPEAPEITSSFLDPKHKCTTGLAQPTLYLGDK